MSCPTDGRLRAYIDDRDGSIAVHIASCGTCSGRLQVISDDAAFAGEAIAGLDGDAGVSDGDADAAHRAVTTVYDTGPVAEQPPAVDHARGPRVPLSTAAGLLALAVVALAAFTPVGRAAAADFLASFRAERFQVVTFDPERPIDHAEDVEGLADIADVEVDGPRTGTTVVDSVAEASEVAGFVPAEATSLPDGASLTAVHAAAPKTVRLRLRADRAPDLPAALDGAEVVVSVPGMVGSMYEVDGGTLVVGEAGQLTVDATGADLADIRAYLLGRPEVPQDLAAQLLAIDDWTTTVPIPIPVDEVVWDETTVGGAPGLMLSDPLGSGLLWQVDGRVHAVGAEGLDVDQLRAIADGIR
ncbi:MAG TPA: hypothetical protein VFZ70_02750 [Euzebyales bacterium]